MLTLLNKPGVCSAPYWCQIEGLKLARHTIGRRLVEEFSHHRLKEREKANKGGSSSLFSASLAPPPPPPRSNFKAVPTRIIYHTAATNPLLLLRGVTSYILGLCSLTTQHTSPPPHKRFLLLLRQGLFSPVFTCGRRPTGHGVIPVVVVVGFVVVVVVVVGGETFFCFESPCCKRGGHTPF